MDPSGFSRTPSRTRPDSGSSSVAVIQSVMAAANSTLPTRAARIAAGPLAGAVLKLSPRGPPIPPPPAGEPPPPTPRGGPARARGGGRPGRPPALQQGGDRRQRRRGGSAGQRPGPLHGESEPGDVVVVAVGPRAEVAQPHGAGQRGDLDRPCRVRRPPPRVDQAVE